MKFSVVVVTYNSDIEKVLLTLKSIISQDFDEFEIVMSDDGSKENNYDKVEAFFKANKFSNYVLLPHEENVGTVKNLICALSHCRGRYVRDFGAGDTFYNKNSMKKIYECFENQKTDMCFGLMRGFYYDANNKFAEDNFNHPFDIQAYRNHKSRDRILKNLIVYSDHISGACMCYKKEVYLEYLRRIEDTVIYEEDIFQVLAAIEGKTMGFVDDYIVWYESNAGVSTKKKSKFASLLAKDVDNFYKMLIEEYGDHKYVKMRKRVMPLFSISNLYARTLLRIFINPDSIRYLLVSFVQRIAGRHNPTESKEKGFMHDKEWANEYKS